MIVHLNPLIMKHKIPKMRLNFNKLFGIFLSLSLSLSLCASSISCEQS